MPYIQPQRRSLTEQYVFIDIFAKFILFITPWQRASTTGLVISGYGLSAFLFSTISHLFVAGSASPLLLILSLGSSFPMILGFFFVRPVPLPEEELNRQVYSETSSSAHEQRNSTAGYTPLLIHDPNVDEQGDDDARIGVELNPSQNRETSRRRSLSRGAAMAPDILPNVHGMKLWCSSDFWLLCSILSIRAFFFSLLIYNLFVHLSNILLVVSGTGLMCMSFFLKKRTHSSFFLLTTIS